MDEQVAGASVGRDRGPVLVTGATGNVGREVVKVLATRGRLTRSAVRPDAGGASASSAGVALLDFRNPQTFAPALEGVRDVFLLRPPAISRVKDTILPFIDAAVRAGAEHVVFLSVVGADRNPLVPHHAIEKHLGASGIACTFLRAGFFAQNLGDAYRADIVEDGRIYVPAGAGRVNFVDTRDLAEAAAVALERPGERHRAWTLTGPGAVTFAEVAAALSERLGRPIRYEPASVPGFLLHLHRRGLRPGQAVVQALLHFGLRFGQGARVDPTLATVLGRPPRSLRGYVADHADLWRVPAPSGAARSPSWSPARA